MDAILDKPIMHFTLIKSQRPLLFNIHFISHKNKTRTFRLLMFWSRKMRLVFQQLLLFLQRRLILMKWFKRLVSATFQVKFASFFFSFLEISFIDLLHDIVWVCLFCTVKNCNKTQKWNKKFLVYSIQCLKTRWTRPVQPWTGRLAGSKVTSYLLV